MKGVTVALSIHYQLSDNVPLHTTMTFITSNSASFPLILSISYCVLWWDVQKEWRILLDKPTFNHPMTVKWTPNSRCSNSVHPSFEGEYCFICWTRWSTLIVNTTLIPHTLSVLDWSAYREKPNGISCHYRGDYRDATGWDQSSSQWFLDCHTLKNPVWHTALAMKA